MTREQELSNLLSAIGLERGVSVEQLADELARMTLPSYVDGQLFQASVLAALEHQLRAQTEAQIDALRRRLSGAAASHPHPPQAPATAPSPTTASHDGQRDQQYPRPAAAPVETAPPPVEPQLPDDATIYWAPGSERKGS
jgi:hypothetical protein